MMDIQVVLERFLGLAGTTLLHATALALITWVLCGTVLKKARPALHAALWTIVLFKFIVPPVIPGEMSLSSWLVKSASFLQVADQGPTVVYEVADVLASASAVPLAESQTAWNFLKDPQAQTLLILLYLVALLFFLGRSGIESIRTWRKVALLPEAPNYLREEVEELSRELGLRSCPQTRIMVDNASPYVIGFLRPTLVIPEKLFLELTPTSRKALFIHELAHVRRGDLMVRGLQNVVRTLLFFWPPVWWVCRRIERFAELACDQWAMSVSRVSPNLYARSLLTVVKSIAAPQGQHELAFARRGSFLEERFEMILKKHHGVSPKLSWLMVPALVGWVGFALAGGPVTSAMEGQEEQRVKRVEKMVVKTKDGGSLPQEILDRFPEADTNNDGKLGFEELRTHLGVEGDLAEGTVVVCQMEDGGEPECNFTQGVEGDHFFGEMPELAEKVMSEHPEADLDGNGELNNEELHQYLSDHKHNARVVVKKIRMGEAGEEDENVFIHEHDVGHSEAHAEVLIHTDDEHVTSGGERHITVHVSEGKAHLAENFPEADLDGDGELNEEELLTLKEQLAESGEDVHVMHAEKIRINIEGSEGGGEEEVVWVTKDGDKTMKIQLRGVTEEMDADGDGVISEEEAKAFINIKSSGEHHGLMFIHEGDEQGLHEESEHVLTEAEVKARQIRMSEERRRQLLAKNPGADLDGDGTLSKDEAQALAAKLQKAKKKQ